MFDRLQAMWQRTFLRGQESIAREIDTKLYEEEQDQARRVMTATKETLEFADQLGSDGDPYKEQIGNIFKRSIVGSLNRMEGRAEGKDQSGPTSSSPSLEASEATSNETSKPEAISRTQEPPKPSIQAQATERTKKKRGRPSNAEKAAREAAERGS